MENPILVTGAAGRVGGVGRTITFEDIPMEPWREGLLERGLPVHPVNHLATMADLHRAGRYDRMSDDVLRLTGQGPLSVQEFVRKNAATFTTRRLNQPKSSRRAGRLMPLSFTSS